MNTQHREHTEKDTNDEQAKDKLSLMRLVKSVGVDKIQILIMAGPKCLSIGYEFH